jgi:hypothetical protein
MEQLGLQVILVCKAPLETRGAMEQLGLQVILVRKAPLETRGVTVQLDQLENQVHRDQRE